ncbi:MAG: hypothetical protein HYV09_36025 [Deltaproteobacteria bacterium]|nr:hypothetical protein [Deltaproteobacteria bacterium]
MSVPACASRPPAPPAPLVAANAPNAPVAARAKVAAGGPSSPHPEAVAHLLGAPWAARVDRRRTVSLPLPDGGAWTHVKYWGVTTLAGYRYGDEHHVALAVFSFAPPPGGATVDACAQRLASWGEARAKKYDIDVGEARIERIAWPPGSADHAKVFVLDARRRSILGTKRYAAAYAVYPAWREACLAVGFAVPEGGATDDARALRDRLVRDALPGLTVKADAGALALEARSDVDD